MMNHSGRVMLSGSKTGYILANHPAFTKKMKSKRGDHDLEVRETATFDQNGKINA